MKRQRLTDAEAIKIAAEELGDLWAVAREAIFDSVAPGVCRACGAVTESHEPDATINYCDACETPGTVVSILVLLGVC